MTKYQSAVIWLGLALIFVRFLTTGQRSLFSQIINNGGNGTTAVITPSQETAALVTNATAAANGTAISQPANTVSTGPSKPTSGPTPHG
jgi:hypothetical protein